MKQHRTSFVGRTIKRVSQLWSRRRRQDRDRQRRAAFLFEPLESRHLMAGDLDQGEGEGTAPTMQPLPSIVLNGGSPQWVPLDGLDTEGGTLTYTAISNNPGLVQTNVPTGNKSLKMSVAGFGDMYFQLFEHLSPRVTNRIIELVNSGFYNDTATNTITFHRILNDFVVQAGDPTGTGSGGSTLADFDDQFHVDLQHNRSGLLSMAKSGDDTNDSQFFITEERNESQLISLVGSPTGGTFTLAYNNQVTGPIAFSNTGDFTVMAASIKSALEGLSPIGAGNVNVTHDPIRNSSGQISDNRRWRVEFTGALGHREVVNLVGSAAGLTGGSNRSVLVEESKSARHLDFNHSIFGILTEGEAVRDAISNVTTNASGTPSVAPVISNVQVLVDPSNGALLLKAAEGASGETDITVRVTDAQGNFSERTFHVIVTPDAINGTPFLNDISPVQATAGQAAAFTLTGQDAEQNGITFNANKPNGSAVDYQLSVNKSTGAVTVTPPAGFTGSFQVNVRAYDNAQSDAQIDSLRTTLGISDPTTAFITTRFNQVQAQFNATTDTTLRSQLQTQMNQLNQLFGLVSTRDQRTDSQMVTVNVAPAPPTDIDLAATSDTGFSNTDNITNSGSIQIVVSGVANGATVKLRRGTETLVQGVAAGNTITFNAVNLSTFGDGVHSLRATQTVGGLESDVSPARDITLDTTAPAAFTTTPPTEASVGLPLAYDASAPGEGTAGFVYSLTSAPTGASINGATGQLTWTPSDLQVGNHVFQIVATDAAGNATPHTINLTVDEPVPGEIGITLETRDLDGNVITNLGANQQFVLHVLLQDLRNEKQTITINGSPTGGTFTLTFGSQTTAPIAFSSTGDLDAVAANIRTALAGLTGIGAGNVEVTHDDTSSTPRWVVEFKGALASQEVTNLTANASGLTGGTGTAMTVVESNAPAGVASLYLDVLYDASKAEVTGPIVYNSNYQLFKSGTTSTPGLIDEVGAFGPLSPIGAGKFEFVSIPMRSKQGGGTLTFTTDPTDDPENRPAAVYLDEQNDEVPFEAIRFGTTSITVNSTFQAVNDTANVNEDSQNQTLTPLANDTIQPGSGNVLTIAAVGATNNGGTVTIAADGKSLLYTPAANFFGTDTFTYTARNQNNETSVATIAVQVQPQNDPPTAVDDAINVPEDSLNFALDVLANDLITPDAGETKKVTAVTQPATGGTVALGPGGNTVTFTPTLNFVGTTSFTYTLSDGNGGTDTATVTLTVTEANDNPVAVNDTATVVEESTANSINVLANDTLGADTGETLTISAVTPASTQGGTVAIGTGGNVTYTPKANFQGIDTFTYTISDGRGGTATGTVSVTVTNTNDPPTAAADTLNAFKNSPTELNVLANDSSAPDPAETLIIDSVTQPAHGTVQITNNGTRVTYTPTTDYTGPDTFTYTIKDPSGAVSQSATVNVTVLAFIPSTLAGFVYFDVDNDGTKDGRESILAGVTVTLTGTDVNSAAINRTLKTGPDGSYKFDNLAPGTYTLTQTQPAFTIDGKEGVGSQGGTKNQNDKIVVNLGQNTNGTNNNFGERGRQASLITLSDFFSSSSRSHIMAAVDNAGNSLWQSTTGTPFQSFANPVVTMTGSQVKVAGTNGQSQPVSATLPVTDTRIRMLGSSGSNRLLQVSSFNLGNPNNNTPPTAVANSYTATEDTALNVAVAQGVLANDTDPNGNSLTAVIATQPQHGTLTLNANGSFLYTPTANYSGPDSFTYRASDGQAQSAATTVTITVTAVNDAPAAVANSYNVTQNTALNVAVAQGVLVNDTDAEGTALTATIVAQPQHGTVTLNANGSFVFTPTTGYTGPDSFTYRASDGTAQSQPATVSLTVQAPNQAPTAVADQYTTAEDAPLNVALAQGVLANDTDPNANPLTAAVVAQPQHGTLTLNANGSFLYTPTANYNGPDSFTYKANDGTLDSATVTVTLTVTAVNDAPTGTANSFTTAEDTALNVALAQSVLLNDSDVEGTALTAIALTQPQHGTLTLNANGSFLYTPTANYNGPDSFTYKANDGALDSAPITVSLTVTAVNDAPVGTNDSFTTNEDAALNVAVAQGVLVNDSDPDAAALTATVVAQPQHGTLTLNANGSFLYTPTANFSGTDGFSYTAGDGTTQSDVIAVTLTIVEQPEGEGESASPSDAALMALLADGDDSDLTDPLGWEEAVDAALEELVA